MNGIEKEEKEACEDRDLEFSVDFLNSDDSFYWLLPCDADIPLEALGIELPLGCRFCI